jgi:serine/threonine protein phosphatase 1
MAKRFVIGDIHGGYKALVQCLDRSNFNEKEDLLICLGDVTDGWSETPECIDKLLSIPNLIYILGNHDLWLQRWFEFGDDPYIWIAQGGEAARTAYVDRAISKIAEHKKLFDRGVFFHVLNNMLFIHGGYNYTRPVEETLPRDMVWDRDMWDIAINYEKWNATHPEEVVKIGDYDTIFIGHTTTSRLRPDLTPVKAANVWNLDQGGGWEGKLTIMDIDTNQYWQSDIVKNLYPNERGRK